MRGMATLSLDVTGRSSDELLALHRVMARFDRPDVASVTGRWHAGGEAEIDLVFTDGRRERITVHPALDGEIAA